MTDSPDSRSPADRDVICQRFSMSFDYPVHFTRGLFAADNPLLAEVLDRHGEAGRRHRAIVYLDSGVHDTHPDLREAIHEYFHRRGDRLELASPVEVIPGGPAAKTGYQKVREVMWTIGNCHLDRQSFVIAVGGASVLDMLGFATSIVHRGLRLVRVPTTTLAQNDAGVGVKNGMDEHGAKNFVGTFAPPFAVINDFDFLDTLNQTHWIGGVAEAFKVAIIKDAPFCRWLCDRAADLAARDRHAMAECVRRCAAIHLQHIATGGDPFEFGSARPLDFGHWAAHKLELMSDFALPHGQAVAIGMAVDTVYAHRKGLLSAAERDDVLAGLARCGLPTYHERLARRDRAGVLEVLEGIEDFREHLGGELTVTLPDGLGGKTEVHQMNTDLLAEAIEYLRTARPGPASESQTAP